MAWQKAALGFYKLGGPFVAGVLNRLPFGGQLLRRWLRALGRSLLISSLPNPMDVKGFKLYWHPGAAFYAPEFLAGRFEEDTYLVSCELLRPGMTTVDLGAHIGYFSLVAARCVELSGKVYAFEPEPERYSLLLKNIEVNGYEGIIRPVRKAVSNVSGFASLLIGEKDSGNASFYHICGIGLQRVTVETTTLDAFLEAEGWPPVHLIKMDIEGAEKAALEGMRELSARNPELRLIMEFAPGVQAAAGVTPEELFEALLRLGFHKFSALYRGVQPLVIPQDIPRLLRMAGDVYVNLLCER